MRLPQITCKCSEIVMKSIGSESKIRSKILVLREGSVFAVCKGCSQEILVPLKVVAEEVNPPLLIKI